MKKIALLAGALVLSTSLTTAQTENKTTVRIKKVENINGVEKTTDTTYTVNGPLDLAATDGVVVKEENGKKKIVIVTDEINGGDPKNLSKVDLSDDQIQKALKAAGVDCKGLKADKMMVVDADAKANAEGGDKKQCQKVIVIKTVKITDPSEADTKLLGKETGLSDGKLPVDKMSFYPNPSNGKFNLSFNLAGKGDTEINVLTIEGKSIYSEKLKDFTGAYDKEIDISKNPKGVYFVKIEQGTHSQLKKVVLE
jgi:hypothetical protein